MLWESVKKKLISEIRHELRISSVSGNFVINYGLRKVSSFNSGGGGELLVSWGGIQAYAGSKTRTWVKCKGILWAWLQAAKLALNMEVSFSSESFPNYVYFIPKLNINYLISAFVMRQDR
jgi:hypothetical protein